MMQNFRNSSEHDVRSFVCMAPGSTTTPGTVNYTHICSTCLRKAAAICRRRERRLHDVIVGSAMRDV